MRLARARWVSKANNAPARERRRRPKADSAEVLESVTPGVPPIRPFNTAKIGSKSKKSSTQGCAKLKPKGLPSLILPHSLGWHFPPGPDARRLRAKSEYLPRRRAVART